MDPSSTPPLLVLLQWVAALAAGALVGAVLLAVLFCVFIVGGWLAALGLLAYGQPVWAFWVFVAWVAVIAVLQ